mmetsp:Transcript_10395/g.38337  ORF Transcript_10395/g.38337 Transcript_10395/m.38337 type:complete len:205 (+) Transcript_10395:3147-3761(+)
MSSSLVMYILWERRKSCKLETRAADFFICDFFPLDSVSISASNSSICTWRRSMYSFRISRACALACSSGSSLKRRPVLAKPSFEKAFVLLSRSNALNRSILTSMLRRAASSASVSLTSPLEAQPRIWSRSFCSFFSSFFRSLSILSFLSGSERSIFCHRSSKTSTPSWTFLRVVSISFCRCRCLDIVAACPCSVDSGYWRSTGS